LQARTENEIEQLNKQIQDSRGELEKNRSRSAVLEELIESGEGLSPGVRSALAFLGQLAGVAPAAPAENAQAPAAEAPPAADGPAPVPPVESKEGDFYGLVADVLKVDPKYEAVIEAALGTEAESIVVGQKSTAQKVIARLRDEQQGRATFLPLDALKSSVRALSVELNTIPGCLGRANEMTGCAGNIKPVADALLGDVLIFETLEQAEAAALPTVIGLSENGAEGEKIVAKPDLSGFRLVTLAGDVIERNGALEGGKGRPDRLGLIGRRNEVARLNGVMDELRAQLDVLAERHATLEKRAAQLETDDDRIVKELADLATKTNELKGVLAGIAREENRSRSEQVVAQDEIRDLEQQRIKHDERATTLRTELAALTEQETAAQHKANEWAEKAQGCESTLNTQRNSLEELRRESSNTTIRIESLDRQCNELSARWAERRDEADRETHRAQAASDRRAHLEVAASEKETQRDARSKEAESLSASVERMAGEKESARMRFEEARGRERATSTQLEQARVQAAEIERQKMEYQLRLTAKLEQGRNEFKIEVLDDLAQRGTPPEITPEAAEEARQLDEKLQRLGPVNMYALEEQKQLAQRLEFLKTQHGDLTSAQNSLKDIIARINRRSRAQFQETFDAVRTQFQEIFRMLFGGGKADLILESGEDVLEAGIEIMASPMGKSPRTTMQLSGGEKALTTIALLFAVFRSRPAPFCILDEVDAPLDEANVDRFNHIVREFMDKSQFLVITHNKKTMGYADVLFGVTMPEPGVSKRMAIKYEEIEKHLPMETIEREAAEKRKAAMREVEAAAAKAAEAQRAADELAGVTQTESADAGEPLSDASTEPKADAPAFYVSTNKGDAGEGGGTAVLEAPPEVKTVVVEQTETQVKASAQVDEAGTVTEQVEVKIIAPDAPVETKIEDVVEEITESKEATSTEELEAEIDAEVESESDAADETEASNEGEAAPETDPTTNQLPQSTLPTVDTLPSDESEEGDSRDNAAMGGGTD
jgi:chromosome segregation ATPase